MSKITFVLFTTISVILSATLAGCSDRGAEIEPVSSVETRKTSETANPTHTESGMQDNESTDHGDMGHETGGHDDNTAHEEQEGKAHEHGEHTGMPGASHWNAPAEAATLVNPVTADAASVQRGRDLFVSNCASCHGNRGRGDGPVSAALMPKPADLVVMAPMHPAGDFFWKIENGRGTMPAWKDTLNENQVWDLVNYIKSLGNADSAGAETDNDDGHNHAH